MSGRFLRQSTAAQSRLTPMFVDDTDFKTPETALTIANTDVKLSKNGAASVNKNSGGGTHRTTGRYSLTFDATDTDTVGELAGAISVAGALPVEFVFFVLEEAVYDALFAAGAAGYSSLDAAGVRTALGLASANLDTQLAAIDDFIDTEIATLTSRLGTPVDLGGGATIAQNLADIEAQTDDIGAAGAGLTAADDAILARLGAPAGASIAADIASRASQASLDTVDDFLDTEIAAIKAKTDNLPANTATELDAIDAALTVIDDFLDTEVAAIKAKTDGLPADPADASDIAASFTTLNTKLDTIDDLLDTEVAAIKAKTDALPADPADASDVAGAIATLQGFVDTEVASILAAVDTEVGAIKAITDAIGATAAARLALTLGNSPTGAAVAGTLSTTEMTSDLTAATPKYANRVILWTSGALAGVARAASAYDGATGKFTFAAVSGAPSVGDTFIVI